MTPLLLALPWLGLLLFVVFGTREPSELPEARVPPTPDPPATGAPISGSGAEVGASPAVPSVSVIVPARNEAVNIAACLRSLTASVYPAFEVIVVDDRSGDATAEIARAVPRGNADRVVVMSGDPLPDGWLGKPWACHQGARCASGELLLFTDADTTHGASLLARAVAGREEEGADLLTLVGTQLMDSFWERLVQPQIFLMMLMRFPSFERIAHNDRWRDAVANGQYLLFTRTAYEAIGGHEAVRDEVVEDLALAQHVKRAGLALRIRSAKYDLATRMYRSLGQLVEGWSKNIVMGGLQSFPRWMRGLIAPVSFVGGVILWLLPPFVLLVSVGQALAGGPAAVVGGAALADLLAWSLTVYLTSTVLWAYFSHRMGAPARYGPLYPLGAAVGTFIFLRSWLKGRNVEWKGRSYRLRAVSERP